MADNSSGRQEQSDPFRATRLWNAIVEYAKQHVEVKMHTIKKRPVTQCFTGADLVDVVFHYLRHGDDQFTTEIVTRDKAAKLCQLFLDMDIMSNVSAESQFALFEDTTSAFYRFVAVAGDDVDMDVSYANQPNEIDTYNTSDAGSNSSFLGSRGGRFMQEISRLSAAWRRRQSASDSALTPTGRTSRRRQSLPDECSSPSHGDSGDCAQTGDEVSETELVRDVILTSLLTLVDIPILDDLLHQSTVDHTFDGQLTLSLSEDNDSCNHDPWWTSVRRCLSHIKGGTHMLNACLAESSATMQKLRVFQCLADYYTARKVPLWPTVFDDIHLGMFRLLMQERDEDAVRVLQLSFHLLDASRREEIHRLSEFLHHAADITAVSLSLLDINSVVVERSFSSVLISSKQLSQHQVGRLVMFMISHYDKMNRLPVDIQTAIASRLNTRSIDTLPQLVRSYCARVTTDEFEAQRTELTDSALVAMMNSVLDDTQMPLKDKKRHLKQFMKHHTRLGLQHFSNLM